MIWRSLPEFDVEVSDTGLVRRDGLLAQLTIQKNGYVSTYIPIKRRGVTVHRLVACAFIGPIPDGKQVNHRDGNRANNTAPNLEYVTRRENILLGRSFTAVNHHKTHCVRGHPFDDANTHIGRPSRPVGRYCRACARERYHRTKRPPAIPPRDGRSPACVNGHAYDDANTIHYRGYRVCRTCRDARNRARAALEDKP